MSASAPEAVLFDIDGTLIDSNYLHVQAWTDAIEAVGRGVARWRVHRAIGKDSTALLESQLGADAPALGERVKELHARRFAELAVRLRPFEGARELLGAVHDRGIAVVLATSAPQDELEKLLDTLDCADVVSAVTSSEDVERAKPDPQVLRVALRKAGVAPERAVLVGDAVWDGVAAARARVEFVGVLSGGIGLGELLEAGASAIYQDAADLLRNLDRSPLTGGAGSGARRPTAH